ncbi:MAG: pyrroloquinoline quinone biosynthesis peptide chaperone PqqD [Mycobacterium sp.]
MTSIGRPKLTAGVRLHFDAVRQRHVLLYPEGALLLNDTAAETLALVDGQRTTSEIIDSLSSRYSSDDLAADVDELLTAVREQGLLCDAGP